MSKFQNERVLITGSDGFIGKHLIERLKLEHADIFPADTYNADITNYEMLKTFIMHSKPTYVFHLAAHPDQEQSPENTDATIQVNIQGTLNLLHALKNMSLKSFIHIGSYKEYGYKTPFQEEQQLAPISAYAISKATAEMYCILYKNLYNIPIVLLRLSTLYGPGQIGKGLLIPSTIMSCLKKESLLMTKGEQKRELTYIDDAIDAMLIAATKEDAIGQIINIGSGKEYAIINIVQKIVEVMGNPILPNIGALPYRKGEVWSMVGDNSKAKNLLGWQPKTDFEEGIKATIESYRRNCE